MELSSTSLKIWAKCCAETGEVNLMILSTFERDLNLEKILVFSYFFVMTVILTICVLVLQDSKYPIRSHDGRRY